MTDHLPECPLLEPCNDEVADHGYCSMQHGVFCIHCQQWCICDRLRACEARLEDEWLNKYNAAEQRGYDAGFRNGVQAAREAVKALDIYSHYRITCWPRKHDWCDGEADILAAIEALKTK